MPPDIRMAVSEEDINDWLKTLYRRLGIRYMFFRDGSMGIIGVPEKYINVFNHLHMAMSNLAAGEKLPEFLPEEPKPKKGSKKK